MLHMQCTGYWSHSHYEYLMVRLILLEKDADNSGGGAVHVTSQGQLILTEGTSMNFQGNHGR